MFKIQTNASLKSTLLLGAATAAALCVSAPARAADSSVETIVVTGSRIAQTGVYSSSPVLAIGSEQVALKGATSTAELLQDLPAVFNDSDGSSENNSSAGIAQIDLHDLGPIRTLVLVDGKRLVAADFSGSIDLNTIPAAMLERVEILTGGASSVYGGDAVSGVVNLILKKDFEGLSFDASMSQPFHTDGLISTAGFIMGLSSDNGKGNVTIYGDYQNRQPTFQGDRKFSAFALTSLAHTSCSPTVSAAHFGFCPGGSGGIPEGRVTGGNGSGTMFTTSGTLVPYDGHTYNFNPINFLQTPNTHYDLGATGHYEVSPMLDFYTRLTFADNSAVSQLAEVPINQIFDINYDNPLITPQERAILFPATPTCGTSTAGPFTVVCGPGTFTPIHLRRRQVEDGPRASNDDHTAFQMVIGAKGELFDGWTYDVSAQYGRTLWSHVLTGDVSGQRFQQGLLVDATGTCMDTSNNCVPIDIFHGAGAITPTQASFINVSLLAAGITQEWDGQGSVTGPIAALQSPWAKTPVSVALGAEWRKEVGDFLPDSCLGTSGCSLGYGQSPAVGGSYTTTEGFGEIQVPIIQDMPFAQQVEFDGGIRFSSYTHSNATSFKLGASWATDDNLRFRGSFNRAVREANINELFSPLAFSAPAALDPCSSEHTAAGYTPSQALCVATGISPAQYLTGATACQGQCSSYIGGNVALKPETGDTLSFGFVLTPTTLLEGFTGTVDYYNIAVRGAITALPVQVIIDECYNPALNPTQSIAACSAIHRDSLGSINSTTGYVLQEKLNTGGAKTQGVDVELNYAQDMTLFGLDATDGSFALNLTGTALIKTSLTPDPVTGEIVCTGQYSKTCGAPAAKWKHSFRATWYSSDSDIAISGRWRFIGATQFADVHDGSIVDPQDAHIGAFNYFDLSGTWEFLKGYQLRLGVNNIFDKKPPIIDGSNVGNANVDSGNTFPGTYDAIGRTGFLGLNIKL